LKKIILALIISLTIILVSFSIITSLAGCKETTLKQLNVYTWEGYLPESVVALFEKETGIKLNITLATDNNMMLALLKGGGKADIVMPTQGSVNRYYEADLAKPLDLKNITNYEKVSKSLREQSWAKWDGKQMGSGEIYVIPYVFGTSGLVVNTSKYTKSLDDVGWEVLFDTALKERVSSKNNIESVLLILDFYGIPRENLIADTQGTLDKIRPKALALKNNVLKFYTTNAEIVDLLKNEEVWVSFIWDGGGRKLSQFDAKFKYVLPKTGGLGWTDTFMIPKKATNIAGANLFINFMLRPVIAAMLTEQSGFTTTVECALDEANGIDKDLYRFTDEQLTKLIWLPNLPQEVWSVYTAFWEELTTVK
jgi:spermidine/putrescine transport system substrate-binding protein